MRALGVRARAENLQTKMLEVYEYGPTLELCRLWRYEDRRPRFAEISEENFRNKIKNQVLKIGVKMKEEENCGNLSGLALVGFFIHETFTKTSHTLQSY